MEYDTMMIFIGDILANPTAVVVDLFPVCRKNARMIGLLQWSGKNERARGRCSDEEGGLFHARLSGVVAWKRRNGFVCCRGILAVDKHTYGWLRCGRSSPGESWGRKLPRPVGLTVSFCRGVELLHIARKVVFLGSCA